MRTIHVSITRTTQVKQYEPVTVTLAETIEIDEAEVDVKLARLNLFKSVAHNVERFVNSEVARYKDPERKAKKPEVEY